MSELWLITAVVFVAVVLGVEASYRLLSHSWRTNKSITRRLALSKQLASRAAVLNALRAERNFFDGQHPFLRRLNDRLAQTGLRLDRHVMLLWVAGLVAITPPLGRFMAAVRARQIRSLRSTALRCPKICSKRNSLDMTRGPSRALSKPSPA